MPTQFGPSSPSDWVCLAQFTIAGSAASSSQYTGTLYPNGFQNASQTPYIVPAGRTLHIGDMTVSATPSVDAQLIFTVNGVTQGEQFFLSDIVSSNSARVRPTQAIVLGPTDSLSVGLITVAANGSTSAVTQNVKIVGVLLPAK